MDPDLLLTLGIVIGALSFPTVVGAFSRGESPRLAILLFFIGSSFIVGALAIQPGGYSFEDVPQVMVGVVRQAFN